MKMKSIFAWVLALGMLSSCSKDDADGKGPEFSDGDVAFLAVNIVTEGTRASSEEDGIAAESEIKSLYLFTFDNAGTILKVPGTTSYYITIPGTVTDAQRVDVNAKKLLVIANPGAKLLTDVIGSVGSTITTYTLLNDAITGVTESEIIDDVTAAVRNKGFTMINSGDETGKTATVPNNKIEDGLLDISGNIVKISDYPTVQQAQNAAMASGKKKNVHIERLAAKVQFIEDVQTIEPAGDNATFVFGGWTLDVINTTFYPFAEKTILSVTHTPQVDYINNFYTEDPNFTTTQGLTFVKVDATTGYKPEFAGTSLVWSADGDKEYRIENTMAAAEQKYGNATRVVVKGTYYPKAGWTGDWFHFAGKNYETFQDLKDDYDLGGTNLVTACNKMYDNIKAYLGAGLTAGNFSALSTADLALITDNLGGQIVKTDKNTPCIRWYQGGLNYYYYEIFHDNEITEIMGFGKYGIVRNNWYELTLKKVTGAGTPWYPDPNTPGPGDPDPTDPIDQDGGYLGIDLKVKPWIFWKKDIEI